MVLVPESAASGVDAAAGSGVAVGSAAVLFWQPASKQIERASVRNREIVLFIRAVTFCFLVVLHDQYAENGFSPQGFYALIAKHFNILHNRPLCASPLGDILLQNNQIVILKNRAGVKFI
jgi:hypothetical protein